MNAKDFSHALGKVNEKYVTEAIEFKADANDVVPLSENTPKKKTSRPTWIKLGVLAACLCLVIVGTLDTLKRFDYDLLGGSCTVSPGTILNNDYYYFVPHKGIMRYTPGGESELILSTYWFEDWQVNEYGIYYQQDLSLYVRVHQTGECHKLYSASWSECTHISFEIRGDGNIIFIGSNKNEEVRYELLLDGVSGALLETVMEPTKYDDYEIAYSDAHKTIGDREFILVDIGRDTLCDLTESGKSVLPAGMLVRKNSSEYWGDALWFSVWQEDMSDTQEAFIILYPDGRNEIVTLPSEYYCGGNTEYLFYPKNNSQVWCTEVSNGETWALQMNIATENIHDLTTDGVYIYTTAPWANEQSCWQLACDDSGKPIGMKLVSTDVTSEHLK